MIKLVTVHGLYSDIKFATEYLIAEAYAEGLGVGLYKRDHIGNVTKSEAMDLGWAYVADKNKDFERCVKIKTD